VGIDALVGAGAQNISFLAGNTSILPEDVNTWGYLALGGRTYSRAVDWVAGNLSRTDGAISGVTFSDKSNAGAVWLEGNGHLASALLARGGPHDRGGAVDLLLETVAAQDTLGSGQTVGRTSDPNDQPTSAIRCSYFGQLSGQRQGASGARSRTQNRATSPEA